MKDKKLIQLYNELFTEIWNLNSRIVANQADLPTNKHFWKGSIRNIRALLDHMEWEIEQNPDLKIYCKCGHIKKTHIGKDNTKECFFSYNCGCSNYNEGIQ